MLDPKDLVHISTFIRSNIRREWRIFTVHPQTVPRLDIRRGEGIHLDLPLNGNVDLRSGSSVGSRCAALVLRAEGNQNLEGKEAREKGETNLTATTLCVVAIRWISGGVAFARVQGLERLNEMRVCF